MIFLHLSNFGLFYGLNSLFFFHLYFPIIWVLYDLKLIRSHVEVLVLNILFIFILNYFPYLILSILVIILLKEVVTQVSWLRCSIKIIWVIDYEYVIFNTSYQDINYMRRSIFSNQDEGRYYNLMMIYCICK